MEISLNHTLVVVALILILADVFIAVDVPTHIAYVILAYVIGTSFDLPTAYKALVGLVSWFFLIGFHYFFFRNYITRFISQVFAKDKYRSPEEELINYEGKVVLIEEKLFIEVRGELFAVYGDAVGPGDLVQILEVDGSKAHVMKLSK